MTKDDNDWMSNGKLFQFEGAFNITAFLAVDCVMTGTKKKKKELCGVSEIVTRRNGYHERF